MKVTDTRKQCAAQLLKRLTDGPSFSNIFEPFNPEKATEQYRRWAASWILADLKRLVPELKDKP